MDNLFAPTIIGLVIQGITTILVAMITYIISPIILVRLQQRKSSKRSVITPSKPPYIIIGVVSSIITFVVVGLWLNSMVPKPTITILSPTENQSIDVVVLPTTGSGSFPVSGISTDVFGDYSLRVYILVHPVNPPASGWWIQQPATVDRNGQWSTNAWYGSLEFPPAQDNTIDILAVLSTPELVANRLQISDPNDIQPIAQSDIVRVSMGPIK